MTFIWLPSLHYDSRHYLNYSFHRGITHGGCLTELSWTPFSFLLSASLWCICLALFFSVGNSHLWELRAGCIFLISRLVLRNFDIAAGLCCAWTLYLHSWRGICSASLATFDDLDLRLTIDYIEILNRLFYLFHKFISGRALGHFLSFGVLDWIRLGPHVRANCLVVSIRWSIDAIGEDSRWTLLILLTILLNNLFVLNIALLWRSCCCNSIIGGKLYTESELRSQIKWVKEESDKVIEFDVERLLFIDCIWVVHICHAT